MLSPLLAAGAFCTAAAAVCLLSFGMIDANPSLFWYDQCLQWQCRYRRHHDPYQKHFQAKTVWIVGASSGIGESLAYRVARAQHGSGKLLLSSRNKEQVQRVADRCRTLLQDCREFNNDGEVVVVPMDVTAPVSQLERLVVEKIVPHLRGERRVDCVIFNAGQGHLSPALETTAVTSEHMMRVNAMPPIFLTQLLFQLGLLCKDASSSAGSKPQLVFTSSVAGRMGVPLSSSYAASKHALHGYVASLQAECRTWLRLDLLCPGPVDTTFFQNSDTNSTAAPTTGGICQERQPFIATSRSMKMSVDRCTQLIMSHMVRGSSCGGEAWIAQQPTLLGLYLQQFLPPVWRYALNRLIGPQRLSLYEQGLDLYDPDSWKRKRKY